MDQYIKIVREKISQEELRGFLYKPFINMIKFVVDVNQEIIALGGEMHADAEAVLLENGSKQEDLWGGNIYPDRENVKKIEFESLINIRPSQNNNSLGIQDNELKLKIKEIISKLVSFN